MRSFAVLFLLAFAQAACGPSPLLIEVHAPGFASYTVEKSVLTPLEQQLRGLEPVRRLRGLALDGRCLLRLDLAFRTKTAADASSLPPIWKGEPEKKRVPTFDA